MKVYFAGELFSLKHLLGNAVLANSIEKISKSRYVCVLPQSLEQRDTTPKSIRDQDITALLDSDVALFNFDGSTDVDSGTIVEFMIAKFLDIPSVIVRTDFRRAGDGSDPWNLMMSFYPRTKSIITDSISGYQEELRKIKKCKSNRKKNTGDSVLACRNYSERIAKNIVSSFDILVKEKPLISSKSKSELRVLTKVLFSI